MPLAEREQQSFAHDGLGRELGVARWLSQKPDVQLAIAQRDDLRAGGQLAQLEANVRELCAKSANDARQREKHHRRGERNGQRSCFPASRASRRIGGAVEVGDDVASLLEQRFARRCELDAPVRPLEQLNSELGLESLDLQAQRRLRDAELPRRSTEVELFGDGDEVAEVAQFQLLGHIP